jgi:hypothetical protein
MSPDIIKIPYSKKSCYAVLSVMIALIVLLLKTCIGSYMAVDLFGTGIFGIFVLVIIAVMLLMIVTRLVPAVNGETALELDENGIKDYIRNIILDWKDIEDIGLKPGRSSAMLIFELKLEADYGKQVFFPLRWVTGKDQEIFKIVLAYFDEAEGIERFDEEEDK